MSLLKIEHEYLRALMHGQSANVLGDDRGAMVEVRLAALADELGLRTARELLTRLRSGDDPTLKRRVIEELLNHETYFFRDPVPFSKLHTVVVPELMRQRAADRRLRIWSAACSTGQEPYSIAMALREHVRGLEGWRVELMATDLSTSALEYAREGLYTKLQVNRGLPARLLIKYFKGEDSRFRLDRSVRDMVAFESLNLAGLWPALPPMDLVCLRNALIYFDDGTKRAVLDRVHAMLRPGGYLFLGGAETPIHYHKGFEVADVGTSGWYRPAQHRSVNGGGRRR